MTYFAALLARTDDGWRVEDVEITDIADAEALLDLLRDAAKPSDPAVLLVEREDEWFGVARLDDDELKIFVSDLYAAAHGELGETLVPTGGDGDADSADPGSGDGASVLIAVPGGDTDLLADLGLTDDDLVELCDEEGMLPGDALSTIAELLGCGEAYDGLR